MITSANRLQNLFKKSTSASKLIEEGEEEFEQLTDYHYIFTEKDWREIISQSGKLTEVQQQRMI
jgi:hypothetical protein